MNNTHPVQDEVTIDLRKHPLDPCRIGPDGLVARWEKLFVTAMNSPQIADSYAIMARELLDAGNHHALVRMS